MNNYKAALIFKLTKANDEIAFEERVICVQSLDQRDAFQSLLIHATKTLLSLQKQNASWEYIGIRHFEQIDFIPQNAESIVLIQDWNNIESFEESIKYYGEALQNDISVSA